MAGTLRTACVILAVLLYGLVLGFFLRFAVHCFSSRPPLVCSPLMRTFTAGVLFGLLLPPAYFVRTRILATPHWQHPQGRM